LLSCNKSPSQTANNVTKKNTPTTVYETVALKPIISKDDDKIIIHQLKNNIISLDMYSFKGGDSFLEVNGNVLNFPIAFDFINSEDFDTAKEIILFKQNNKYIILLPTFSEGFTTFIMLEFSQEGSYKYLGNHTYNSQVFNQIKDIAPEKRIYFLKEDKTKTPRIYIKYLNKDLLFSEVSFNKPDLNAQSEYEKVILYKKSKIVDNKVDNKLISQPSVLIGEWAIDCENGLTTFGIDKENGIISLYGNSIYINVQVEKLSADEYILKFKNIADQKSWVEDSLKITESDLSKDKIIGRFFVKKDGHVELHWIGLYDMKKKKIVYGDKNFSLIRESGGKNPMLLKKCS
jgi:hypothetical protein